MPDAKPLTREERANILWAWQNDGTDDALVDSAHADLSRYEATVRAAEARIEALRAALDRALYESVGGLPMAAERTMKVALSAYEPQSSGDYSVTRTPESAGDE